MVSHVWKVLWVINVFFRIDALNEYDMQKHRREGALNALESFIFDAKQKLESEEDYISAATPEEAEKIRKLCAEVRNLKFHYI